MVKQKQAHAVAQKCLNAYSVDRYRSWKGVAAALAKRGYTEQQIEIIMRSKLMRWAADEAGRDSNAPSSVILAFIDKYPSEVPLLFAERSNQQ